MNSLLNKTSRYYILFSLLIFTAGGFIFFFEMRDIIDSELTESLFNEGRRIEVELNRSGDASPAKWNYGNKLEITELKEKINFKETVSDTLLYEKLEDEILPFRQLRFGMNSVKGNYVITIRKSMMESDDLVETITRVLIILFSIFIVTLVIITRWMNKKLWKPFNETLQKLNEFELSKNDPLLFKKTNIREFEQLNSALTLLSNKVISDYNNIKEFTENASHEIQTPLSVIINKLENLIQTEGLNEQHFSAIQAVYEAAIRLSKLNNSLLLLTKIDNKQFVAKEQIDFRSIIKKQLKVYEDVIHEKQITLITDLEEGGRMNLNSYLAETLFSNLISNAIKHNVKGGNISIKSSKNELIFSNTGTVNNKDTSELFKRFKKADPSSDSLGLGLAIIKKIADNNGIVIDYKTEGNTHILKLRF